MKLWYLLSLLIIISASSGATFDSYDIIYDAEMQTIKVDSSIFIENETSGLDFSVFAEPKDLKVTSSVPIEHNIDKTDGYKIMIDFLEPTQGNVDISIQFKSNLIESVESRDIFSIAFQAPLDIKNFSLNLILPETSQVFYQNNQPLISPRAMIGTDGKRIMLNWKSSLDRGESFIALASYTKPQKQFPWLILIVTMLTIFAAASFSSWKFFKSKSHRPILTAMSEDEREIFHFIKSQKGITQEDLREKTGHSKSKISKLIRNLEKMDVIKKTPYKKTNKLESKL